MQDLSGYTALVTGSTSGIGKATALALARHGARVLVSGRDTARGEAVTALIRAEGGNADFLQAEMHDAASARDLAGRAVELAGHVDILVNNAGIYAYGPTAETKETTFDDAFAINVKVPYMLVGKLAPLMVERGRGAIVNVTTMAADIGLPGTALYGSTKASLNLLTKAWAAEYGPKGVRVNAVSPGPTRTEGTAPMGDGLTQIAAAAPAGRPATPDEIASAIVFLAGPDASFVHGIVMPVDGGRIAV